MHVPLMSVLDWIIVCASVALLTWFGLKTVKYMRGVADFLAANRSAGRYMLTLAGGMTGLGAISVIAFFEQYYEAGFPTMWWPLMIIPAAVIITLTGWIRYRFRETRCLTLPQFFEVRYSRNFRIFTGIVIWLSGVLNFGIFPYVASNFFVYFCGLPPEFSLLGLTIKTFLLIMLLTTGMALLYTCIGGQITVMITDCVQGIFCGVAFVALCLFLLSQFSWADISHSLKHYPEYRAREKAAKRIDEARANYAEAKRSDAKDVSEKKIALNEAIKAQSGESIAKAAKGKSIINPFDTSRVGSFNVWFYLILLFNVFYGLMSWQGSQAYNSSGISPHEQKMGGIIGTWRNLIMGVTLILLAICALTFLTHPDYVGLEGSREAHSVLSQIETGDTPQLAVQQRVPVALAYILPTGMRGLFCVVMILLLVTTQDTYLHSWGSIFIQDVVMPLRKKPLEPKQHVNWIRWSIVGVAVFAFAFSCFYKVGEFISMYMAITGAIFSGLGCAIIGGLYWKFAGTIAAFVAVGMGAVLSVARILVQQYKDQIAAIPNKSFILRFFDRLNGVNSQYVWFFIMLICIVLYMILSLIEVRKPFNIQRMLHRGKYDIRDEHKKADDAVKRAWLKITGITEEFTRVDRILAFSLIIWNFGWFFVFIVVTIINFTVKPFSFDWWSGFWRLWVWINVVIGVVAMLWFTVGGIRDLKRVFARLTTIERDERDDGRIVGHHLASEEDTIVAQAQEEEENT